MSGFFGKIIGTIISRMLIMGIFLGGGQYYLSQNGGISGLFGGGAPSAAGSAQPISAGIGGLGAVAASLGIGGPSTPDYFEVQGRISKIRVECRLVRETDGKMTRTEPLSCDRARTALSYPQFSDYTMSEARTATYIYYAMDGVNVLKGKTTARGGHRVGDVISLRVNRDDQSKSTPI